MPIYEIVVAVCLIADPAVCKEDKIPVQHQSPTACMMGSPPLVAKWADEHPKWEVKRWTCVEVGKFQAL